MGKEGKWKTNKEKKEDKKWLGKKEDEKQTGKKENHETKESEIR